MSRVDRYEYKDWKGFGVRTMQYRKEIGLSKEKFSEMINRSENFVSESSTNFDFGLTGVFSKKTI